MSPTETSTLSFTTISTTSNNFFLIVYNYQCGSYAFSMSPTKMSTLSFTTISTAWKNFFLIYN